MTYTINTSVYNKIMIFVCKVITNKSDDKTKELYWEVILSNVERFTKYTLMTEKDLFEYFEGVHKRGYIIDCEENELGVICVVAPIYNHRKDVQYTISVSTLKLRVTEVKIKEFDMQSQILLLIVLKIR
ncbi:MAG: IclR family transcriptional regulator C-terminal domain-containing protein [Clostridiales bacterium]|nr:IclR family transcriptional regulator C-terminal domain-containing protein [Clostridiales bacterium]